MFSTMLSLLGSLRRGNFVTNSLRFRSSASAFLSRTFATPTSSTVFTWSGWVKRGNLGVTSRLFGASTTTSLGFNTSNQLSLTLNGTAAVTTAAAYTDPSAWYHVVYAQNGAAQTIYVNGSSAGTGTTANTVFNTAIAHQIGAANTTNFLDGYLTEIHFIDGQALTPSSFGQIESTTGLWSPKQYVGTYGANGFYLKFSNTTSLSALGTDTSGNGNAWAVNNASLVAGGTYDSMLDVPVNYNDGGNGRGNYSVLNPLASGASGTSGFPEANLSISGAGTIRGVGTIQLPTSGKWYFEVSDVAFGNLGVAYVGVGSTVSQLSTAYCIYQTDAIRNITGSLASYGLSWGDPSSNADVIGVAVDQTLATITFYKNNVSQGAITHGIGATLYPIIGKSGTNTGLMRVNFGQRPFSYTPPAGFRALNTNNLPTP